MDQAAQCKAAVDAVRKLSEDVEILLLEALKEEDLPSWQNPLMQMPAQSLATLRMQASRI